jgi:hypothetical protein
MKHNTNIYITLHEAGLVNEKIISFLENFTFSMKRVVKSNYSLFIKGRDFTDENALEYSKKSDLFVFLLDEDLEKYPEFRKELDILSNEILCEQENADFHKIFKVSLSSYEENLLPECIGSFINYTFYEFNVRKNASIPFDPETDSVKYWGKMLDLVYDINESIDQINHPDSVVESDCVYLGTCSPDQMLNRDDIKRELQHLGLRVLPITQLPEDKEQFTSEVLKNLNRCRYIFQLIGQHYGKLIPGEKWSLQELENQLIRDAVIQDPQKNRMIWIPVSQKQVDQKQDLFVNRIRRDDPGPNSEIIESSLNEFKNTLQLRLSNRLSENLIPHSGKPGIYVISKQGDEIAEIKEIILKNSFEPITIDTNQNGHSFSYHLEALNDSEGLVICYYDEDARWLTSKIKDVIKSIGQGRKETYKGICMITDLSPDLSDCLTWLPQVEICRKNDYQALTRFIQKLKA